MEKALLIFNDYVSESKQNQIGFNVTLILNFSAISRAVLYLSEELSFCQKIFPLLTNREAACY